MGTAADEAASGALEVGSITVGVLEVVETAPGPWIEVGLWLASEAGPVGEGEGERDSTAAALEALLEETAASTPALVDDTGANDEGDVDASATELKVESIAATSDGDGDDDDGATDGSVEAEDDDEAIWLTGREGTDSSVVEDEVGRAGDEVTMVVSAGPTAAVTARSGARLSASMNPNMQVAFALVRAR